MLREATYPPAAVNVLDVSSESMARRFRFHDLRHTFGSLLIQDRASLAYVKEQMGHSSIQITVDVYGHLIPGANIAWVDRLDAETTQHQSAPGTHQANEDSEEQQHEAIRKLAADPRLLSIARETLGNETTAFRATLFDKSPQAKLARGVASGQCFASSRTA